jgi:hypothetical protein
VWTHSLVLDYQALALIPNLFSLVDLFTNPVDRDHSDFSRSLSLSLEWGRDLIGSHDPRTYAVLSQLYGDLATQEVVAEHVSDELDTSLALALWRQMWPSLRRGFAFSTAPMERTIGFEADCSLRFARQASEPRLLKDPELQRGFDALAADLPKAGPTALRTFLGRHVIESSQPRRLALRLATWDFEEVGPSLRVRLDKLRALTHQERLPRLVRDVTTEAFKRVSAFDELFELMKLARNEVADVPFDRAYECALAASAAQCRTLLAATNGSGVNTIGGNFFEGLVNALSLNVLALAATASDRIAIAHIRPEVIFFEEFWPESDVERAETIVALAQAVTFRVEDGLKVFGTSIGKRTLGALLGRSGHVPCDTVDTLVQCESPQTRDVIAGWLFQSDDRFRSYVDSGPSITSFVIETLAHAQVREFHKPLDAESWYKVFSRLQSSTDFRLDGPTLAVGFVCSLFIEPLRSQWLALAVYDRLHVFLRDDTEKNLIHRYLEIQVPQVGQGLTTQGGLVRAALDHWPIVRGNAGALNISKDRSNLRDFVREASRSLGRSELQDVLSTIELSHEARLAADFYRRPSGKGRMFWWW